LNLGQGDPVGIHHSEISLLPFWKVYLKFSKGPTPSLQRGEEGSHDFGEVCDDRHDNWKGGEEGKRGSSNRSISTRPKFHEKTDTIEQIPGEISMPVHKDFVEGWGGGLDLPSRGPVAGRQWEVLKERIPE